MPLPAYPLVNGNRYDYASAEIHLNINGNDTIILGITEVTYKNALDPGEARGTHPQILGRGRGQYKPEASISMYKQEAAFLIETLGDGYMEVPFDIVVNYSDNNQPVITDRILSARIKEDEDTAQNNNELLVTKFPLHVLMVLKNGTKPIKNMLGV